jgi:hypothetical protein
MEIRGCLCLLHSATAIVAPHVLTACLRCCSPNKQLVDLAAGSLGGLTAVGKPQQLDKAYTYRL